MFIFILIMLVWGFVMGTLLFAYDYTNKTHTYSDVGIVLSSISLFAFIILLFVYPYHIQETKLDDFIIVKTDQYIYFIKGDEVKISTELKFANIEKEHIDLYIVNRYNIVNQHLKSELKPIIKGDDNAN